MPPRLRAIATPVGQWSSFVASCWKMPAPPSVALLSAEAANRARAPDRTVRRGCAFLRVEASEECLKTDSLTCSHGRPPNGPLAGQRPLMD
jgi:hypothetical protein